MRTQGKPKVLIIGCGDVGQRLAKRLLPNHEVIGVVRSQKSLARLSAQGITPLHFDLDKPPAKPLPAEARWVFYFAPPPKTGRKDTRMQHFLQALDPKQPPKRLLYLSTTGVYGDCHGAWVDEHRPARPRVDRAWRRWDAEQRIRAWCRPLAVAHVILRVASIYGPGKLPLGRLRARKPMIAPEHAPWTNRIHIDDLIEVCLAAMQHGQSASIYNVSDGHPGNMADYFNRVADYAGLPRPPVLESPSDAQGALSRGLRAYLAESRRIDNRKIREELGIRLRYPTLEAGLAACFATKCYD